MRTPSLKLSYFLGLLFCGFLFIYSVYLQINDNLQPCPLCVLQRFSLIMIGFIFLIGTLFKLNKIGQYVLGSFACLFSILGAILSGRQVWLQHSPHAASESCGASLQYMIQVLPFDEVLKKIFQGTAECTQVGWQFLYLSLAEWSFICFMIFFIFSAWQSVRK